MKLPPELKRRFKTPMTNTQRQEVIIRDCANVLQEEHNELAKRSYPPPTILLELRDAVLARYGLEKE